MICGIDYGQPWYDEEGFKMIGPYHMVAADLNGGTFKIGDVIETSHGKAIVVDQEGEATKEVKKGSGIVRIDFATRWGDDDPAETGLYTSGPKNTKEVSEEERKEKQYLYYEKLKD